MSESPKPSLFLAESANDSIAIVAEFPHTDPDSLFDYWVKPDLLKKWWPPEAELNAHSGGTYHFSWANQNWHLRGTFQQFNRGKELAFTWKWDHEKVQRTQVKLKFEKSGEGTRLTLNHEWYPRDASGKKTRDQDVEGWMHFLGKLQERLESNRP